MALGVTVAVFGTIVQAVLIVAFAVFCLWALVWLFLLPALMISDADNGRFGRDMWLLWLPEFGSAATGVVYIGALWISGGSTVGGWVLIPLGVLVAIMLLAFLFRLVIVRLSRALVSGDRIDLHHWQFTEGDDTRRDFVEDLVACRFWKPGWHLVTSVRSYPACTIVIAKNTGAEAEVTIDLSAAGWPSRRES